MDGWFLCGVRFLTRPVKAEMSYINRNQSKKGKVIYYDEMESKKGKLKYWKYGT